MALEIGDHRLFVIDILTSSLIGCNPPKIVRAAARRHNTIIPEAEANYVHKLEALMDHHNRIKFREFWGKCSLRKNLRQNWALWMQR